MLSESDLVRLVEEPVRNLCRVLNRLPDVNTLQSCGGDDEHGDGTGWWVQIGVYSWESLEAVVSCLGYDATEISLCASGWDADKEENHDPSDWGFGFTLLGSEHVKPDDFAELLVKRFAQAGLRIEAPA